MKWAQVSLGTLLILVTAWQIWFFLVVVVAGSSHRCLNPLEFITLPQVLLGIAASIHIFLRGHLYCWLVAVLIAPMALFTAFCVVAVLIAKM